jgi:hypothetical protein
MVGDWHIPAFKVSPAYDEFWRALRIGHLVSIRSPLSIIQTRSADV